MGNDGGRTPGRTVGPSTNIFVVVPCIGHHAIVVIQAWVAAWIWNNPGTTIAKFMLLHEPEEARENCRSLCVYPLGWEVQ